MLSWDYTILGSARRQRAHQRARRSAGFPVRRFARFAALDTSLVLVEIRPVLHGCKQSCLVVSKPPLSSGTRYRSGQRWWILWRHGSSLPHCLDVGAILDFGSTVWYALGSTD
jgi:hypothetical protein